MANQLLSARSWANRVRFMGDIRAQAQIDNSGQIALVRRASYESAIEISPLVTPDLYKSFRRACERIHVPTNLATPFIYSATEVQGQCFAGEQGCIVRFSSGLVDLLDEEEFEFVVGHELGHFLLAHHAVNAQAAHASYEYFRTRRAQEISCDRIGFLACKSLDVALRALMKTISGLTSRHLRFDVLAFIAQLRKSEGAAEQSFEMTHPSVLLRARAILWFSLCDLSGLDADLSKSLDRLRQVDERIERDLAKFVDGAIKEQISRLKEDLLLWMTANEIVKLGALSTQLQTSVRRRFGDELVEKLKSFLGSLSKTAAEKEVFQRMLATRKDLEMLIPNEIIETVSALNEEARRTLKLGT